MTSFGGFLKEYRLAYRHKGGIKVLALGRLDPVWFAEIQREMSWVIAEQTSSDVTDKRHTTNWTKPKGVARQFSLYNPTGRSDDYLSDFAPPASVPKKLTFPHLTATARFAKLFGDDLWNLRLNGLGVASGLSLHEESPVSATRTRLVYRARFHMAIFTNPDARLLLDGEQFRFDEGILYFFHHGCVHAAINPAETPRYHLVLDCEMTPALHARIFPGSRAAPPDDGFQRFRPSQAAVLSKGSPAPFGEFVTEKGKLITGIDYGRRVPTVADWYRSAYPSVFGPLDSLLGRASNA